MQLTIEKRYRENQNRGITFLAVFTLTRSEPTSTSLHYLGEMKLTDLAARWYSLQDNPHLDTNAAFLVGVPGWSTTTLHDLTKGPEFKSDDDPTALAAVEEGIRRALAMLPIMDAYADPFAKRTATAIELDSPEAAPTGLFATKPSTSP